MNWLVALALALLLVALLLRRTTGVPWQRVVSSDTSGWRRTEQPMLSRTYGLVGKPDYVVETRRCLIPIEVKPTRRAGTPYPSDVMQLAAYCLLIEDTTGARPPYGLLRYAETTFQIRFDDRLRGELLEILQAMHTAADWTAQRSHDDPARCAGCGFVRQCDEALA